MSPVCGIFYNCNHMRFEVETAFGINFGLLEVLKIDDDDDYDDNDNNDVFSSTQRISHTICTRGGGG